MIRSLALCALLALAACGSKFKTYDGPEVTGVIVNKEARTVHLLHHNTVLRSYPMEMGFAPVGHKQIEGDGKTPEGQYWIDRRNPNSKYHLSVGVSYPNPTDRARAAQMGKSPGGEIFIHGTPREFRGKDDWTAGCIAVSNDDIEEIYAMVKNGVPIWINP